MLRVVRVRVRVRVAEAGDAGRTTIPHIRTVRARSRAGSGRCWEGAGRGDERQPSMWRKAGRGRTGGRRSAGVREAQVGVHARGWKGANGARLEVGCGAVHIYVRLHLCARARVTCMCVCVYVCARVRLCVCVLCVWVGYYSLCRVVPHPLGAGPHPTPFVSLGLLLDEECSSEHLIIRPTPAQATGAYLARGRYWRWRQQVCRELERIIEWTQ